MSVKRNGRSTAGAPEHPKHDPKVIRYLCQSLLALAHLELDGGTPGDLSNDRVRARAIAVKLRSPDAMPVLNIRALVHSMDDVEKDGENEIENRARRRYPAWYDLKSRLVKEIRPLTTLFDGALKKDAQTGEAKREYHGRAAVLRVIADHLALTLVFDDDKAIGWREKLEPGELIPPESFEQVEDYVKWIDRNGDDLEHQLYLTLLAPQGNRLSQVIGMSGLGKTQMVLTTAARQLRDHFDKLYLVPLNLRTDSGMPPFPLADNSEAARAVSERERRNHFLVNTAQTLNIRNDRGGLANADQLIAALADAPEERLIIFDNYECVHCSEVLSIVLRLAACINVRVLLVSSKRVQTSRSISTVDLSPGLSESAARDLVKLTTRRLWEETRGSRPEGPIRAPLPTNAQFERIYAYTSGNPLLIRIVCAHVPRTSWANILSSLNSSVDLPADYDRYHDRHEGLSMLFRWSLSLISEGAQRSFYALAVFRSPVVEDEFARVTGASPSSLWELRNNSLVALYNAEKQGTAFRLQSPLWEYARTLRPTEPAVLALWIELAEQDAFRLSEELRTSRTPTHIEEALARRWDDIFAALSQAIKEFDSDRARQAVAEMRFAAQQNGRSIRPLLEQGASGYPASLTVGRLACVVGLAALDLSTEKRVEARAGLQTVRDILENRNPLSNVERILLARLVWRLGQCKETMDEPCRFDYLTACDLAKESNEPSCLGAALRSLANLDINFAKTLENSDENRTALLDSAAGYLVEARNVASDSNDVFALITAYRLLGELFTEQGLYENAVAQLRRSKGLAARLKHKHALANIHMAKGRLLERMEMQREAVQEYGLAASLFDALSMHLAAKGARQAAQQVEL